MSKGATETVSASLTGNFLCSAVGRKQLMALTGLVWSGFVLTHMAANLLIIFSPDAFNKYGHALAGSALIYATEALLIVTIALHIFNGIWLTIENKKARNTRYAMPTNGEKAARFQSKYMVYHGLLIAAFLIIHIQSFKFGAYYETKIDGVVMRDLHRLVVEKFHDPTYVAGYLVALVLVGLHLSHGFYSSFSSLGVFHPRYSPLLSKIGYVYATVVALGFMSQPLYVFFIYR